MTRLPCGQTVPEWFSCSRKLPPNFSSLPAAPVLKK